MLCDDHQRTLDDYVAGHQEIHSTSRGGDIVLYCNCNFKNGNGETEIKVTLIITIHTVHYVVHM